MATLKSYWLALKGWQRFYIAVLVALAVPGCLLLVYLVNPAPPTANKVISAAPAGIGDLVDRYEIYLVSPSGRGDDRAKVYDLEDPKTYPINLLRILAGGSAANPETFRSEKISKGNGWEFEVQAFMELPQDTFDRAVFEISETLDRLRAEAIRDKRFEITKLFLMLMGGVYLFFWFGAWIETKLDVLKEQKIHKDLAAKRAGRKPDPEVSFFETGLGRYLCAGGCFVAAFYFSGQSGSESGWLALAFVLYGLWLARELGYIALFVGGLYLAYWMLQDISTPKAVLLGAAMIALAIYTNRKS